MDIPSSALPAIGACVAAIFAGGVSFVVTVLAKEQKISEFRQAWIDGLRDDLSHYLSHIEALSSALWCKLLLGHTLQHREAFLDERYGDVHKMNASYNRIIMRLNPTEHKRLLDKLNVLNNKLMATGPSLDMGNIRQSITEVVTEGNVVLKTEWETVKRGEWTFRIAKYFSLLFFIIPLLGILLFLFHQHP